MREEFRASGGGRNRDFIAQLIEFSISGNAKQNVRNAAPLQHQSCSSRCSLGQGKEGFAGGGEKVRMIPHAVHCFMSSPVSTAFGIQGKEKRLDRRGGNGDRPLLIIKRIWIGSGPKKNVIVQNVCSRSAGNIKNHNNCFYACFNLSYSQWLLFLFCLC